MWLYVCNWLCIMCNKASRSLDGEPGVSSRTQSNERATCAAAADAKAEALQPHIVGTTCCNLISTSKLCWGNCNPHHH